MKHFSRSLSGYVPILQVNSDIAEPLSPEGQITPIPPRFMDSYTRRFWRIGLYNLLLEEKVNSQKTVLLSLPFGMEMNSLRAEPCHHCEEMNLTLRTPWGDPDEPNRQSSEGRVCKSVALQVTRMQIVRGFVETTFNSCGEYMVDM